MALSVSSSSPERPCVSRMSVSISMSLDDLDGMDRASDDPDTK